MLFKVRVVGRIIALAAIILCVLEGCAPFVATQQSDKITVAPAAEKNIFIKTDWGGAEIGLIRKPLEEMLAAKGYKLLAAPKQSAYTMKLHLLDFELRGEFDKKKGSMAHVGTTAAALSASSASGAAGYGAASLLFGGSSREPFVGRVEVVISSPSAPEEEQDTVLSAVAKISNQNQEPSARQAVGYALAKKIAALMP